MIGGTLDRKSKRTIIVRVAIVWFVLLVGMVVVGAAGSATGAEDTARRRWSSVLHGDTATATGSSTTTMMTMTTVVEEVPVPGPVPTRKVTKNHKASKEAGGFI